MHRGPTQLYSITISGEVLCKACENEQYKTLEIWLAIASGKIVDLIPVAFDQGDDISRQMRYYYFDTKQGLLLKDFTINELSISYKGQEQWQINATNRIKKLNRGIIRRL